MADHGVEHVDVAGATLGGEASPRPGAEIDHVVAPGAAKGESLIAGCSPRRSFHSSLVR